MYLKRLELSGFKSFPKKTTLKFEHPITAIVGPNGSGKSNVVEAVRFVLGEQKIKSLRGKSGADLIFQGSKSLPASSRAFVSSVFDNKSRVFKLGSSKEGGMNLDFDEITISREVYKDGSNKYKVNGSEVRLKDIQEIAAGVNIGSSGHHIISQGESDRILNASPRDRREMVEDALGLRIYKYRLREAERKLARTQENLREVELLRREIAPHLKFLSRQVDKIKKAEDMRKELEGLYKEYFSKEEPYILEQEKKIEREKKEIEDKLDEIEELISGAEKFDVEEEIKNIEEEIIEAEGKQRELRSTKDILSRELGKIEAKLEFIEEKSGTGEVLSVSGEEILGFLEKIEMALKEAEDKQELVDIKNILERISKVVKELKSISTPEQNQKEGEDDKTDKEDIRKNKNKATKELVEIENKESELEDKVKELRAKVEEKRMEEKEKNRVFYELKMQKNEFASKKEFVIRDEEKISRMKIRLEEEKAEARASLGFVFSSSLVSEMEGEVPMSEDFPEQAGVLIQNLPKEDIVVDEIKQENKRRKIERLKIKLEDAGGAGGGDTLKEYEETYERDRFLVKEVEDLKKSIESLEGLMGDLQGKIDSQFEEGIGKINAEFQRFFELMFGGGTASLSLSRENTRKKVREKDAKSQEEDVEDEGEQEEEVGVDINVNLPRKKARGLHVLSGGERSLTSIALLFAMTQVNPPPFLILDETDAALDEANSRRYGDMLERLSKHSQLMIVTHNRETMSRAHVLYGVTMDSSASSKLLSVKIDEAVKIAK